MTWISDDAVARLRGVTDAPDFSGSRYRMVREIGRGGMGAVYECEDTILERPVAVKVLATELSSPEAAERLRHEAIVVAQLEHPGVVPVHDAGQLPDGRTYYSMKLVRGARLDAYAGAGHATTELLRVFLRVCETVAFAHAHGVVHGDLKPENIMVGEFGAVLVMDWGVAQIAGESSARGLIAGTPGFMAPEQASGRADFRSDVYALGAVLKSLASPLPRPLAAVANKSMADESADRFETAADLSTEIARYIDGEPLLSYRAPLYERIERWISKNRALVAIIAAYLLMRVIVFLVARF